MFTAVWIVLGAVGAVTELVALARPQKGDTLSEHFWRVCRVKDPRPTPVVWVIRALVALVMIWLAGHFSLGWWTPSDPWPG